MNHRISIATLFTLFCLAAAPQHAFAIHIKLIRMKSGSIPGGSTFKNETAAFVHPSNGTPADQRTAAVMQAAAGIWSEIFAGNNDYTITIRWGFQANMGGGAGTTGFTTSNGRIASAYIVFDDVDRFVDPDAANFSDWRYQPADFFGTTTAWSQDNVYMYAIGTNNIPSEVYWLSPIGDAKRYPDMLTVAMHEIGHALGLNDKLISSTTTSIKVNSPIYGSGSVKLVRAGGIHTSNGSFGLMAQGNAGAKGLRVHPSVSEVLAIASVSKLTVFGPWVPDPNNPEEPIALQSVANGSYVTANWDTSLIASGGGVGDAQTFDVVRNLDGTVSFLSWATGLYVTAEDNGASALIANRSQIDSWEKFFRRTNTDGTVSFISLTNGEYVCAENAGASPLIANRTAIGPWESFWYQSLAN